MPTASPSGLIESVCVGILQVGFNRFPVWFMSQDQTALFDDASSKWTTVGTTSNLKMTSVCSDEPIVE
jgi:hypothetical protein